MCTISDFLNRLDALDVEEIAVEIIAEDTAELTQLQKDQLWAGKDNEGNDLTPTYLTDPYFKTQEQAKAYMEYKYKLTPPEGFLSPYPDRKKEVPNLWITGYWQSGIQFKIEDGGFFINTNKLNPAIIAKYPKALGLNETGLDYYRTETFNDKFMSDVRKTLQV